MARLLPLFPLQLVVFPGAATPLHIFEERYREMVGEAEAAGTEFGIVRAISRGSGSEQESGIASTGCTVTVESVVSRYPDGRFDVVTRGKRRFRIVSLDDEKAYLRGEVEYFDDEQVEPVPAEVLDRALEAHERLQREVGDTDASPRKRTGLDLSFHLAEDIDDLDFRSLLLQSRSEPQRLRLFTQFVTDYIPRRQYMAYMKQKAPTNGSGHKRPGI
jgi:Lon protease-like protein